MMPQNVYELINETYSEFAAENDTYANCLIKVIKKHHIWPVIQVKKFKDNDNLVLLHNTYDRNNTTHFKELYDQCRSVIIDFSDSTIKMNTVVSYSNNIPQRISIDDYAKQVQQNDRYQEAFDGTMITVYHYNDKWHIGTSSCPDVNNSKFNNPHKSHGQMLDEILFTHINPSCEISSQDMRDLFTANLDKSIAYEFVLLHHENLHIIDYTNVLGPEYKLIYHINSKNRYTLEEIDITDKPLSHIGIQYPSYFKDMNEAYACMNSNPYFYGVIVKQGSRLLKISPPHIEFKEETDPCNPNIWHNILMVYMKNKKDYQINDYIKMYAQDLQLPVDDKGIPLDPTYLIHTMILTLKDVLYNLYVATTTYNPKTNRFRMNKELDNQFPPVIRFHLAQLRYRQIQDYQGVMIRSKDVYTYLCHHNNVKNIRLLITFLATSTGYNIKERAALCLTVLNSLL